jgi:hypothetical protein
MDPHELFFQSLTSEEEQLIIIRDFLYDGDWNEVVRDLNARKSGKPFIFKLNSRIEEDLGRIERLRDYESTHGVNLGAYLLRSGKFPELLQAFASEEESKRGSASKSQKARKEKKSPAGS